MAKRRNSRPQISAQAIKGNLVFSEREVMAVFVLPPTSYEYQKQDKRIASAEKIDAVFSALMRNNPLKPIENVIWVNSVPYDALDWINQWHERVALWGSPAPGFTDYSLEMAARIEQHEFNIPQTTVGVILGKRGATAIIGNDFSEKMKSSIGSLKETLTSFADKSLAMSDPEPSTEEVAFFERRAQEVLSDMNSTGAGVLPASAEHITTLIKAAFYPSMSMPDVTSDPHESWGQGEIYALGNSRVYNHPKYLRIQQEDKFGQEVEGYKATLAFTRFPQKMLIPQQNPWIYAMHATGVDSMFYGRFTLVPNAKVRKDIDKKVKSTKDEMQNAQKAGVAVPIELQERLAASQTLDYRANNSDAPWVYGRWRLVVSAPDKQRLDDDVKKVITYYASQHVDIVRPTGDQLDLLFESLPGDYVRLKSYMQYHNLSILGGGMPTATSAVGDSLKGNKGWFGPYIGYTTSGMLLPVHLSPHVPIAQNQMGGLLMTGAPGGGKSYAAFTLTCQMAMQGAWCIYIDPKCDALPMARLDGIGKVNVFNLSEDGGEGVLDPFRIVSDPAEQTLMATEIITLLLGRTSEAQETAINTAAYEVSRDFNPSLEKVYRNLLNDLENPAAQSVAANLRLIKELPYAKLCFGEGGETPIKPQEGLTIITLLGLDVPDLSVQPENYTKQNRLAVTILYLVSTFTMNLMSDPETKTYPKAVVIDEAWSLTSTPQGKAMLPKIARLGRSLNTSLVLVSQNAGDFISDSDSNNENSFENSMTIRMAFRAGNEREARSVAKLLDAPGDQGVIKDVLNLDNGECLLKDNSGRIARVQIDAWNQEWHRAFETNPDKAAANAREVASSVA